MILFFQIFHNQLLKPIPAFLKITFSCLLFFSPLLLVNCIGKSAYTKHLPRFLDSNDKQITLGAFLNYTTETHLDIQLYQALKKHYSFGHFLQFKNRLEDADLYLVLNIHSFIKRNVPSVINNDNSKQILLKGTFTLRKIRPEPGERLYYAKKLPFEVAIQEHVDVNASAHPFNQLEKRLYSEVAKELDFFMQYGKRKTPLSFY